MRNTIILYSGGMDSSVALYKYASQIRRAVSFNYGSKHNIREIQFAKKNCELLGIEHQIVDIDLNKLGFVSDLLIRGNPIPDGKYSDETLSQTVVPFRNGIMLSIAAGISESIGCNKLLITNHGGDHSLYPDCRDVFIKHMNAAIVNGTSNQTSVMAPFTHITKRDIAHIGQMCQVPFELTYSCYKGGSKHCGTCSTCMERREALIGFDPTEYLS